MVLGVQLDCLATVPQGPAFLGLPSNRISNIFFQPGFHIRCSHLHSKHSAIWIVSLASNLLFLTTISHLAMWRGPLSKTEAFLYFVFLLLWAPWSSLALCFNKCLEIILTQLTEVCVIIYCLFKAYMTNEFATFLLEDVSKEIFSSYRMIFAYYIFLFRNIFCLYVCKLYTGSPLRSEDNCGSLWSPSTMWDPGIEFRFSGLKTGILSAESSH